MNKIISIIVPVYNILNCVHHCIESISPQLNKNVELILVDDGSKDESGAICDEYASKYPFIKVLHKQNGGLSSARNAGLSIAEGEYIIFVDGDDYLDSDAVKNILRLINQCKADVIQYRYREVNNYNKSDNCNSIINQIYHTSDKQEMFRRLYTIGGEAASACTKVFKRWIFDHILFREGVLHEDEFFVNDLFQLINSIDYALEFVPYNYVMREGSIIKSNYSPKRIQNQVQSLKERIELLKRLNFIDVLQIAQQGLFTNLLINYNQAANAKDTRVCELLQREAYELAHENKLNFIGKMRFVQKLFRFGLPAFRIVRFMRTFIKK